MFYVFFSWIKPRGKLFIYPTSSIAETHFKDEVEDKTEEIIVTCEVVRS
jgi:hypothetical protein